MKINAPKEKYIFIELNKNDMKKLHLNYEDMDYANEETRIAIYSVLRQAKQSLGQNFELSDTMRVEALPREDGGCFLLFTIGTEIKSYRYTGRISKAVYLFENADNLIDFSVSLKKAENLELSSSLYLDGKRYYLFLKGRLRHSIIMRMNEYAAFVKSENVPVFNKNQCIISENALEVLCGTSAK